MLEFGQETDNPCWANALQLYERLMLLGRFSPPDNFAKLAERRIAQWSTQFQLDANEVVSRWCQEYSVSSSAMRQILGSPSPYLMKACEPPKWLPIYQQAVQIMNEEEIDWTLDLGAKTPETRFDPVLAWPWIRIARRLIQARIAAMADRPLAVACEPLGVMEMLLDALRRTLQNFSERTLVLELNVARVRRDLSGDNAELRYRQFCQEVAQPKRAYALLREYAVLARLLSEETLRWIGYVDELLSDLETDWPAIVREIFAGRRVGRLVHADLRAGDRHDNGRSVCILTFESGNKVVYKPRSLASQTGFHILLDWLEVQGLVDHFKKYRLLDFGSHGWSEYVESQACKNEQELEKFYYLQGQLLAVAFLFRITDLNSENFIARREYPVFVDAECFFHPFLASTCEDSQIERSVLGIGLLPRVEPSKGQFDPAGLTGGSGDQLSPFQIPLLTNTRSDACKVIRGSVRVGEAKNIPTGDPALVSRHVRQVIRGFQVTYQKVLNYGSSILESAPVANLRNTQMRVIPRRSSTYSHLLFESTHPNLLRDALDREVLFSALPSLPSWLTALAKHERAALWNWDIPSLECNPDEPYIRVRTNPVPIGNLPGGAPFSQIREHVTAMCSTDIARHIWTIRASMSLCGNSNTACDKPWIPRLPSESDPVLERCLAMASQIGLRLIELADRRDQAVAWIDIKSSGMQHPGSLSRALSLGPMGLDLYSGAGGMLFFFVCLSLATSDPLFTTFSDTLARSLVSRISTLRPGTLGVGGMSGLAGILYVMTTLSTCSNKPEYDAICRRLIDDIRNRSAQDQRPDLFNGIAGAICSILTYYSFFEDQAALTLAMRLGQMLVDRAVKFDPGIGWISGHKVPLGGLAHGNAGIAYALALLFHTTGREVFRTAAIEALQYERTTFNSQVGNWRDLRDSTRGSAMEETGVIAWCTGAPSIGFSRLGLLDIIDDPQFTEEIETAFETTMRSGLQGNDCLCHGCCGNLLFLQYAASIMGRRDWHERVDSAMTQIIKRFERQGFRFQAGADTLNLMTGLAGCGYAFLNIARPNVFPYLPLLAPPNGVKIRATLTGVKASRCSRSMTQPNVLSVSSQ